MSAVQCQPTLLTALTAEFSRSGLSCLDSSLGWRPPRALKVDSGRNCNLHQSRFRFSSVAIAAFPA
jgi:hypothetical protein